MKFWGGNGGRRGGTVGDFGVGSDGRSQLLVELLPGDKLYFQNIRNLHDLYYKLNFYETDVFTFIA